MKVVLTELASCISTVARGKYVPVYSNHIYPFKLNQTVGYCETRHCVYPALFFPLLTRLRTRNNTHKKTSENIKKEMTEVITLSIPRHGRI